MTIQTSVHPSDNQPSPESGKVGYRVVPNGRHWDVLREGVFAGTVSGDVSAAIDLAIREARREHEGGAAVSVSVLEKSDECLHVWP